MKCITSKQNSVKINDLHTSLTDALASNVLQLQYIGIYQTCTMYSRVFACIYGMSSLIKILSLSSQMANNK